VECVGICRVDHVAPLYPLKLTLTLLTSGGHSIGIVRSHTQAMELVRFVEYKFNPTFGFTVSHLQYLISVPHVTIMVGFGTNQLE
jgi:hypothetical protein